MKVSPRATESMPRVATKGGTERRDTSSPFTAPSTSPVPTPARMATMGGWAPVPVTRLPATMPHSASMEPTERSMPPARMT